MPFTRDINHMENKAALTAVEKQLLTRFFVPEKLKKRQFFSHSDYQDVLS
jgi:hypothetical protein